MNGWLLDRSVLLHLRRFLPNPHVKSWSDAQPMDSLYVSTSTIAELRDLLRYRDDPRLGTETESWLDHHLRPWFTGRLLPVTEDILLEWRQLMKRQGLTGIGPRRPDPFLVATARVHDLTVCARNDRAYRAAGASAFSPWTASSGLGIHE